MAKKSEEIISKESDVSANVLEVSESEGDLREETIYTYGKEFLASHGKLFLAQEIRNKNKTLEDPLEEKEVESIIALLQNS